MDLDEVQFLHAVAHSGGALNSRLKVAGQIKSLTSNEAETMVAIKTRDDRVTLVPMSNVAWMKPATKKATK